MSISPLGLRTARCKKVTLTIGLSKLSASSLCAFPFVCVFSAAWSPAGGSHSLAYWFIYHLLLELAPGLLSCDSQQLEIFSNKRAFSEPSIVYLSTENKVYAGKKTFQNNQQCKHMSVLHKLLEKMLQSAQQACFFGHPQEIIEHHSGFLLLNNHYWTPESVLFLKLPQPCRSLSFHFYLVQTFTLSNPQAFGKKNSLDWVLSLSALFSSFISLPSPSYLLRKLIH